MGVLSALLRSWSADPKGRVLLGAWAATVTGVTLRAVWLRRLARRRLALAAPAAKAEQPSAAAVAERRAAPSALRAVGRLAVPRWSSEPVVWCAVLSGGIALRLLVQVKTSQEIGALGSLLAKQDWPALYRQQLTYALYAVPAAVLQGLQKFASGRAALAMRVHLTRALHDRYEAAPSLALALREVEAADATRDGGEAAAGESGRDALRGVQRGTSDLDAYCKQAIATFEALFKPSVEASAVALMWRRWAPSRKLHTRCAGRHIPPPPHPSPQGAP